MELRINEVAKARNMQLKDVAQSLGITYTSLYRRLKSPSLKTLEEIAAILKCEVAELLSVGDDYMHYQDPQTGTWLGICRKSPL